MKQSQIGRKHTEETKEKMRMAQTGKKHSVKTKKKISIANSGKKRSNEFKIIIAKSQRLTVKKIKHKYVL